MDGVIYIKQLPNDAPDIWSKKEKVFACRGVGRVKRKDGYYFTIDLYEADMDEIAPLIKGTISDEDYEEHFMKFVHANALLEELAEKTNSEEIRSKVSGDICFTQDISHDESIFDLTSTVLGDSRLRCRIKTGMLKSFHIGPDQHVDCLGTLKINGSTGRYELYVDHIQKTFDATELQKWIKEQRYRIRSLPKTIDLSTVKERVAGIKKIAVLTNDNQAAKEFESIISGFDVKLVFCRQDKDALCYDIDQLCDKVDAICIIKGTVKDDYALASFSDAGLCNKVANIDDDKCLIFTGIGRIEDSPLITKYVFYNAPTAQELAMKLSFWKATSIAKQKEEAPAQLNLVGERQGGGFFHALRKLLPW